MLGVGEHFEPAAGGAVRCTDGAHAHATVRAAGTLPAARARVRDYDGRRGPRAIVGDDEHNDGMPRVREHCTLRGSVYADEAADGMEHMGRQRGRRDPAAHGLDGVRRAVTAHVAYAGGVLTAALPGGWYYGGGGSGGGQPARAGGIFHVPVQLAVLPFHAALAPRAALVRAGRVPDARGARSAEERARRAAAYGAARPGVLAAVPARGAHDVGVRGDHAYSEPGVCAHGVGVLAPRRRAGGATAVPAQSVVLACGDGADDGAQGGRGLVRVDWPDEGCRRIISIVYCMVAIAHISRMGGHTAWRRLN